MTREDVLKNAISLLGITFPIDSHEFKVAYRRACFIYHPDRRGDEEQFKKIQEIYRLVKDDPTLVCMTQEDVIKLVDGTPISSLGLGLGPTQNGVDCKECGSKGYTVEFAQGFGPCPSCKGSGQRNSTCSACRGTGRFKLRSGREVECRDCKGSGRFLHKPKGRDMGSIWGFLYNDYYCERCHGSGRVVTDNKMKPHYYRCPNCEGTGEIPIYNPVIPKGALAGKGKKR